ncbi:MAG: DUF2007 domain-containing protein [Candidatus Hydrogenedentes bacterium]|nr:DUF2007 domain-containing protein [Candidatus Hydrogenedentota bacterium]
MYCPDCGTEFEDGVEECPECKVALVAEEPDDLEPVYQETVKVFESNDAAEIAVAESILQGAEIPYVIQNAVGQNLLGGMTRESAFAAVEVPPEFAEDAAGLLDALDDPIDEAVIEQYEDASDGEVESNEEDPNT